MAFKMNRGNNLGSSPNKLLRMGISKRVRKLFGGKHHTPKKGHYDIDRGFFGPVDWDHTWQTVKDFFGSGKSRKTKKSKKTNRGNFVDQSGIGDIKGKKPLPTTMAQYNVGAGGTGYEDEVFEEGKEKRKSEREKRRNKNWMQT